MDKRFLQRRGSSFQAESAVELVACEGIRLPRTLCREER
jgi:hypothetical protein